MATEISCPQCNAKLSFGANPPKFCSECGFRFSSESLTLPTATVAKVEATQADADAQHTNQDQLDATQDFDSGSATRPAPMIGVPKMVPPYRILDVLGRGGMGAVYRAEDMNSGRQVAIKFLGAGHRQTTESIERFKREGQIAASISHARSTFVYSAGKSGDLLYIVMELMPGGTLKDEVQTNGPLEINRAVDCMLDVIDGLIAAHEVGIIHRDIKPSNCFVEDDGRVKIGDYGLSKSFDSEVSLTRTGAFMGTPQFAAPEQVKGEHVDERTDIYAIGCTLFYLLTGRPPFEGDFAKVILGIATEKPPQAREVRKEIPPTLAKIIAATLEKDPVRRPQTLSELRHQLEPFATKGTSFADVGRRIAAYCIDWMYVTSISGFFVLPALFIVYLFFLNTPSWQADYSQPLNVLIPIFFTQSIVAILYFAIAEGVWGCGIGKMIMGLRVSNFQGELPSLLQSFIRSLVFPGTVIVLISAIPFLLGLMDSSPLMVDVDDFNSAGESGARMGVQMMTQSLTLNQSIWIISALFLVTMRKRNGYRGVHEFLSGTRVRRTTPNNKLEKGSIPLTVPFATMTQPHLDRYQILGAAGRLGQGTVFVAFDPELNRNVWISYGTLAEADSNAAHTFSNRPTRQRWLDHGRDGTALWNVWESVSGTPLSVLVKITKREWPAICELLIETANELHLTSLENQDILLDTNQVWVDEAGHVKLVNFALQLTEEQQQKLVNPAAAFVAIIDQVALEVTVPIRFLDFVKELNNRQGTPDLLPWAIAQLESQRPFATKWKSDDRLGSLAISAGLELSLLQIIPFGLVTVLSRFFPLSFSGFFVITTGAVVCLTFAAGYWLRGGLVFSLLKIIVYNPRREQIASRLHCGIRNVVTWSLVSFSYGLIAAWLATVNSRMTWSESTWVTKSSTFVDVIVPNLWSWPLMLFNLAAIFALINPSRGIQDFICRTKLIPK
ncbi:MAG TPA: protein kinase [Pirellulaceae bacterium]|nr:protein kinase [Pirellulaceae bacterium]HMO93543.1 protein kinase [Pirellulaceae bacterium]HMP70345.1 protein kinase [Pirellulaceae bacterium]